MKSINKETFKNRYIHDHTNKIDWKDYLKTFLNERDVGLMGKECRFLANLKAAFQTKVNNLN